MNNLTVASDVNPDYLDPALAIPLAIFLILLLILMKIAEKRKFERTLERAERINQNMKKEDRQ